MSLLVGGIKECWCYERLRSYHWGVTLAEFIQALHNDLSVPLIVHSHFLGRERESWFRYMYIVCVYTESGWGSNPLVRMYSCWRERERAGKTSIRNWTQDQCLEIQCTNHWVWTYKRTRPLFPLIYTYYCQVQVWLVHWISFWVLFRAFLLSLSLSSAWVTD